MCRRFSYGNYTWKNTFGKRGGGVLVVSNRIPLSFFNFRNSLLSLPFAVEPAKRLRIFCGGGLLEQFLLSLPCPTCYCTMQGLEGLRADVNPTPRSPLHRTVTQKSMHFPIKQCIRIIVEASRNKVLVFVRISSTYLRSRMCVPGCQHYQRCWTIVHHC